MSTIPKVYSLPTLVEAGVFPSLDWLRRRLTAGTIPGRKIGRSWVMTAEDVAEAIEGFKNNTVNTASGITPTAASRRARTSTSPNQQ